MLTRMLNAEWRKVRKSGIWIPVILAPGIPVLLVTLSPPNAVSMGASVWKVLYENMDFIYGILFLPLMTGVIASLMCRFEHLNGGWKQLLAMPIRRTTVYAAKFIIVLGMLALAQLLVLIGLIFVGKVVVHTTAFIPWGMLTTGTIAGWAATIPLAALQLWVATWWKSFGAQFAINVIMTIPATAVADSRTYGPIYPWAQPALVMVKSQLGRFPVTNETGTTIVVAGMVFIVVGWFHFVRRDVQS